MHHHRNFRQGPSRSPVRGAAALTGKARRRKRRRAGARFRARASGETFSRSYQMSRATRASGPKTPGKRYRAGLPVERRQRGARVSLASPTHVTPARAASTAPQVAETRRSSAVRRSSRATVSFLSHAKKSPSSGSRKPRSAVSSRCVWELIRPGRIAASPKSQRRASGNLAVSAARAPTPAMRSPGRPPPHRQAAGCYRQHPCAQ